MKNLLVQEKFISNIGVKNGSHLAVDTLNECSYIATKTEVNGHSTITNETTNYLSLSTDGYLKEGTDDRIIAFDFLQDQECLSIITTKGDVLLWQPETNNLENAGSVESGFTSGCWSPDQELLVLTTKNDTLIVMTKDFDPLNEFPLHPKEFGEAQPMNVGWGKKETQFHGSEGKEAAKLKKVDNTVPILPTDDMRTEISWRGDGQFFSITSVDLPSNVRYLRIYDREGIHQATNELIDGLEQCIQWRPSGNLIATSQRKPNKHDIIFFEKNGLQHGEFTLPFKPNEKIVKGILWSPNSDILTIRLQDIEDKDKHLVQLWTVGNYHWYLKQEMVFIGGAPSLLWDPENAYKLHFLMPDGRYQQNIYVYDVIQSKGTDGNLAMVAVIDGSNLLLTAFRQMVLPPPMSTHTVALSSAINQAVFGVGDKQHDLIVQCSSGAYTYVEYDSVGRKYSTRVIASDATINTARDVLHFVFLTGDRLASLAVMDGSLFLVLFHFNREKLTLSQRSKLDVKLNALKLFKSEDKTPLLLLKYKNGMIRTVDCTDDGNLQLDEDQYSLPHSCETVASRNIDGKQHVFGLTSHFRMFMNDKEIATNCTSFILHDEFLLLTTHSHLLRCVYFKSLVENLGIADSTSLDEAHRRVERGSRIVTAVSQGTAVILQMPRGNLECIHPRALVVSHLQKLLTRLEYKEALEVMRKNRINLNLMYDHNPQLFLQNADTFVNGVNSANRINLFLADLSSEDVCTTLYFPFYHHGEEKQNSTRVKNCPTKVDIVCQSVREAIERSLNEPKLVLSLLTTYAKQSVPDLETVLVKLKEIKDKSSSSSDPPPPVTFDKALSYILYLIDVNQLFDIALGLYDFDIVIMVAEKSQKDPKEYLPFLNNFKNMEVNYRKYSIDKYLKKYTKSLQHLIKCDGHFSECLEFVKEHDLYRQALDSFTQNGDEYKQISSAYGEHLHKKKYYEEAAIIFSRCGFHEQALESLKHTTNWNMALIESKLSGHTQEQFMAVCRKFCERLKSHRLYADAALLQEHYVKDIEESTICLLDGHLWFQALNLIQKYEREDLIETNLKPAIQESYEYLTEKIHELQETFTKHKNRLTTVMENKKREEMEIMEGLRDDPQNDLYSDTSSITGQSAISASSNSSKGTRTSGHSRKSRNKGERKKYSLREGNKHEDFALREALAELVNTADSLKEEVCSLCKILLLYFYEKKAINLQTILDHLLNLLQNHKIEIWAPETNESDNGGFEYGPGATVQDILHQKNTNMQAKPKGDLPEQTRPVLRTNVKWKLSTISNAVV